MQNFIILSNVKLMKIAVFHNLKKGGAKRALFEIAKRLSINNDVDLFTINSADNNYLNFKKFIKKEYIFKIKLPRSFLLLQFFIYYKLPKLYKKIAKKIDKLNYDFVFINHDFLTKSPYLIQFLKTPSFYLCHEPPREFYDQQNLFSTNFKYKIINFMRLPLKFIDISNVKKVSFLLANSHFSKKKLENTYKRKAIILKLGVDTEKFNIKKGEKSDFFLTVGALALFKGYDFLIKSISRLPKKLKFPIVAVADGGRDKRKIFELAKKLNVKLIIKKNIKDSQLIDLYNNASLFLYAGCQEPLGLSVLEAMACGLPIVAVKEGGVKELFYKNYKGLVKRNTVAFSNKIFDFLTTDNLIIKNKLRNHVRKNWQWESTVKSFENFLKLNIKK